MIQWCWCSLHSRDKSGFLPSFLSSSTSMKLEIKKWDFKLCKYCRAKAITVLKSASHAYFQPRLAYTKKTQYISQQESKSYQDYWRYLYNSAHLRYIQICMCTRMIHVCYYTQPYCGICQGLLRIHQYLS